MKRVISVFLALSMIFTMSATVSALSVAEKTAFIPNPNNIPLVASVGSKASGTDGDYQYPPAVMDEIVVGFGEQKGVDYRAKLDMGPIRDLFEEEFLRLVFGNDAEARAEFEAGLVSTTINVLIEYPAQVRIDEGVQLTSRNVGVLDAGSIFSESARVAGNNSLKITYVNRQGLTVRELRANVNSYLKDISLTLNDTIAYSEEGNYVVKVTLSGETVLDFATKDQRVIYSGAASNVVYVKKDNTVVNHRLEVVPVTPATCLTTGKTEGIICRTHNSYDCGALGTKEQETIPVLEHIKIPVAGEAATCTTKGMAAHWTCKLCKSDFDDVAGTAGTVIKPHEDFVLPKTAHTEVVVSGRAATCTTVGFENGKKCSVCDKVTQAQTIIPALGHSEVTLPAVAATCTVPGKTAGKKCNVCNAVLIAQIVIPATGHKFGEWRVVSEATESTTGLKERYCIYGCGEKEELVTNKRPHTHAIDASLAEVVTAPTCTEEGSLQNYCRCGAAVGNPVAIPATGHTTERVAPIESTCVLEGIVEHYTCTVCDGKFRDAAATSALSSIKQPINKNNHGEGNYVTIPGIVSTCIHHGFTNGQKCKNCNVVTIPQTSLPLAAHTLETIAAEAATCTEHGVKEHKHCAVCNKDFAMDGVTEWTTRDFDLPALGHSYGDPVKDEPERFVDFDHFAGKKPCLRGGCSAYIEVGIPVTPANCNHVVTLDVITLQATCTATGERKSICAGCALEIETVTIPMMPHNLVLTEQVDPTCHSKGTAAYYTCSDCGKMFSAVDASREITNVRELELAETAHDFRVIGGGNNLQCRICREVVHVKKKDKDGNDSANNDITVNNKNVGIKDEDDKKKEERYADVEEDVTIESEIIIQDREEVSKELDDAINDSVPTTNDEIVDKVVWDISIEKITKHTGNEVDREPIKELDDLIEIVITIPEALRSSADFLIHRYHVNELGEKETHIITTTPNADGEYIVINRTAGTVTLKVKKFSEYVLVGYTTTVNKTKNPPSVVGSLNYTVQFKANGGTTVENLKVDYGKTITAPTTTRDGYVFAGWYTDATFAEKYDFTKPVKSNMTLYAKWVTSSGTVCDGTEAGGCPAVIFNDVNTSLWYHAGIDYVVEKGLMIGITHDLFAPDANITRGMLVTVLGRIEEAGDTVSVKEAFTDVANDMYYAKHINWAVDNNIVYGYGDGRFGPEDFITREQIAAIIHRYAQFKGYDVSAGENTNVASYSDYSKISGYAIPSVQYVVGSGLMKGKSDATFNPIDKSTRAEVATILYRFLEANK